MGSSGEATDQEAMAPSTPAFLGEIGLNLALSRPGYFMLRLVAAIAPWFRLRLPSCGPGFESQAHHLCFFNY